MSTERACGVTHPCLLEGVCPWCEAWVVSGRVADHAPGERGERRWDIQALLAGLDSPDVAARHFVVCNVEQHGPRIEEALPVFRKALADLDPQARQLATSALHMRGADLFAEEARWLEAYLLRSPDDLAARGLLLGWYFLRGHEFEADGLARQQHALWVIANAPGSELAGNPLCDLYHARCPEAFARGKELWQRHVEASPTNTAVLGNAANYFFRADKELAEGLYRKAQALEPEEPFWCERLGHLYELMAGKRGLSEEAAGGLGRKALAEYEKAHALTKDAGGRFTLLVDLAKAALKAGDRDKARRYAREQLALAVLPAFSSTAGLAIFHGNTVLGRLALQEGDNEGAKRHLIEAGKTPGYPSLCSFGPGMMLAKELLERGERVAVLEYLRLCSAFWQTRDQRIDLWIYQVEQGEAPDFGSNLAY
jgi:tetratricopeptide (TPR) repeat protein